MSWDTDYDGDAAEEFYSPRRAKPRQWWQEDDEEVDK